MFRNIISSIFRVDIKLYLSRLPFIEQSFAFLFQWSKPCVSFNLAVKFFYNDPISAFFVLSKVLNSTLLLGEPCFLQLSLEKNFPRKTFSIMNLCFFLTFKNLGYIIFFKICLGGHSESQLSYSLLRPNFPTFYFLCTFFCLQSFRYLKCLKIVFDSTQLKSLYTTSSKLLQITHL